MEAQIRAATIGEFHALLQAEEPESPLLGALRKLTEIGRPEDLLALTEPEGIYWTGWTGVEP